MYNDIVDIYNEIFPLIKKGTFSISHSRKLVSLMDNFPIYLHKFRQDIAESGMTVDTVFGDYEKSPFDPLSSPASILVAQKEKNSGSKE